MTAKTFWKTTPLGEMNRDQWESLCDGCGRCCLRKLEDEDTGEIAYTDVACRLLDCTSCRCRDYPRRLERVPDCVGLTPANLAQLRWMPTTCAYRLLYEGKPLPDWHPLISGSAASVHAAGISVAGFCVPEDQVDEDEIEAHIIDWVTDRD
jgi:uncharacterized cysteine cluster protein YcgN (CxxCxxCC family)